MVENWIFAVWRTGLGDLRNSVVSIWTLQLVCSALLVAGVSSFVEGLSVALKLAAAAAVFVAVLAGSFEGAVEKTVVEGFGADFVPEVAAVEVAVEVAAEAAAEAAAEVAAAAAAAVVAVVAAAAAVGAVGLAVGLAVDLVKPVLRVLLPSVMEVAKGLAVAAVFVRPEDLVDLDYSIGKRRAAWPYAGFVAVAVAVVQHAAGLELEQLGVVVVVVVASAAAAELAAVVYEVEGPDIGPHYWLLEWQLFAGDLRH
jgi:hypothetical protein